MKTPLLRITAITALLTVSSTGVFAGPGLDYWQRKQATRAATKVETAKAEKAPAAPATACPMTPCPAAPTSCCKS